MRYIVKEQVYGQSSDEWGNEFETDFLDELKAYLEAHYTQYKHLPQDAVIIDTKERRYLGGLSITRDK